MIFLYTLFKMKGLFQIDLLVKRYLLKQGALPQIPQFQSFRLEVDEDVTVLQALHAVKAQHDGSVSYRWSCQMGICGSCGMTINGRPALACSVYCKDVVQKDGTIRIEPMRNMPILKDLIVDIDDPMSKMRSVMPYIDRIPTVDLPGKQSKKQREKIDKTSQCIKCMLCYSACPVYGQDKNFVGPAASALAYRYTVDSRDHSRNERLDQVIGEKDSVWGCSFVGECSVACPKRVDPAQAVQRLKVMGAIRMFTKPLMDLVKK